MKSERRVAEECRFVARCFSCDKDHNSWLHGDAVMGKGGKKEGEGGSTTEA